MSYSLSQLYSVQGRSTTRNALGGLGGFAHKFYWWGEVPREGPSRIQAESGTLVTEDTLRLRGRRRSDINIGDRLVDGDTVLHIRSVIQLDRNYLQITATRSPGGAE